jgi:carbon storage regulator
MLVLSRKREQEIKLPDFNVTLKVLEFRGKSVKVGVVAPGDVRIVRGELTDFDETVEFDFAAREREADSEYTKSGDERPLGGDYQQEREVTKCA